mmetsp:Transcript_17027/g.48362  ORF Transcript_17027/g.48362 Transcript_17027/m.48362 type:complete len:326 (-) Transcript_17027:191-1168(-)
MPRRRPQAPRSHVHGRVRLGGHGEELGASVVARAVAMGTTGVARDDVIDHLAPLGQAEDRRGALVVALVVAMLARAVARARLLHGRRPLRGRRQGALAVAPEAAIAVAASVVALADRGELRASRLHLLPRPGARGVASGIAGAAAVASLHERHRLHCLLHGRGGEEGLVGRGRVEIMLMVEAVHAMVVHTAMVPIAMVPIPMMMVVMVAVPMMMALVLIAMPMMVLMVLVSMPMAMVGVSMPMLVVVPMLMTMVVVMVVVPMMLVVRVRALLALGPLRKALDSLHHRLVAVRFGHIIRRSDEHAGRGLAGIGHDDKHVARGEILD